MDEHDIPTEPDLTRYQPARRFENGHCPSCGSPQRLHLASDPHACPRRTEDWRVFARTEPDGEGFYGWIRWHPGRLVLLAADDSVALDVSLGRVRSLCGLVGQDRQRVIAAQSASVHVTPARVSAEERGDGEPPQGALW